MKFIYDLLRRHAIRRDLKRARKLLNGWHYKPARALAEQALTACSTLSSPALLQGRCHAAIAETIRREASGVCGVIVDNNTAQTAIPHFRAAAELLEAELGMTSQVRSLIYNQAVILSELERYQEALPIWRRLMTLDQDYADNNRTRWRLGQALNRSGQMQEALQVLRQQVSIETKFLDDDENFKKMNVTDVLIFDYYRGAFELAGLLVETAAYEEAEPLCAWLVECADRPGLDRGRRYDHAQDRARELLAECLWGQGKHADATTVQLQRIKLACKAAPGPGEQGGALTRTLDSVEHFYKARDHYAEIYESIEQLTAELDVHKRTAVAMRKASALASNGRFHNSLEVLAQARTDAPRSMQNELNRRTLAVLVLAGRLEEATRLAQKTL